MPRAYCVRIRLFELRFSKPELSFFKLPADLERNTGLPSDLNKNETTYLKMPRRKKNILKRKKKTTGTTFKRHATNPNYQHGIKNCCIRNSQVQPDKKTECCDNGDAVKRKAAEKFTRKVEIINKKKSMEYKSVNRPDGLSPKEKSYVICKCQARSVRYQSLKLQAAQAIRENKIFSVLGSCNAVRKALLERGWVEKLPAEKMNLSKIKNGTFTTKPEILGELEKLFLSYLVDKYPPNFIWRTRDELRNHAIDITNNECSTIISRLNTDALWTSKQGLCSSMKRNYWFYIEDVAEVIGPRSYSTSNSGEIEGFVKDYKITACTSLLKWVLSMVANERPVFVEKGKVSLNVLLFALCRCKEYLYRKENRDIDRAISNASNGQWNKFLKNYYRIIGKDDVFQKDTENNLPLYMGYAKMLLKHMHRFRPQLSCEGCHNIWIIKPAHNSRGRGIRLASKLTVIDDLLKRANDKYVVQKYIEEPLLIHETKFDIRQYCLVTSTYPLVIWMYRDCYLKFSSQKYNLKNYHESIHLTNNAVQRKYNNCEGRHEELPPANMWHSEKYKDYLDRIDKCKVWDNIIYPGMKKSIIGIMLTGQDSLAVSKNRFELYGCDFVLDKEYKPWLIEINSSPDLHPTTPVTATICPAVLSDVIKVVIDHAKDPSSVTGKFECIYRQPMTIPRYGGALDLYVRGFALPNEYFYKGDIHLRETYDYDEDIWKGNNIKALLDKIKRAYYSDSDTIMVEPEEDDSHFLLKMEKETTTHNSQSDHELNVAATLITAQLDKLTHKIVSEHNLKSRLDAEPELEIPDSVKFPLTPAYSVTDIKTMVDKALQKYISARVTDTKESFDFSELDDGPLGKASVDGVNSPKKVFNYFKKLKLLESKSTESRSLTRTTDFMLEAATKLINFINKKEQEYSTE